MFRGVQGHGEVQMLGDLNCSFPPILETHSQLMIPLPPGPVAEHLPRRGCCSRVNSPFLFLVGFSHCCFNTNDYGLAP